MISAKIIADSISEHGKRITTMELNYQRFIHAEAKTHRVIAQGVDEYEVVTLTQDTSVMSCTDLSRNASSSRAIPVAKMIEQVRTNPAAPLKFMKNQPGMQATVDLDPVEQYAADLLWRDAAVAAAGIAESMAALGVHKQFANRILEPFQWIRVIVTATEWDNFFALRDHKDAQPEIQELARQMRIVRETSEPVLRYSRNREHESSWHLPYVSPVERATLDVALLPKLSAARCARVSYLTHDGQNPNQHEDLTLFARLVGSVPLHASPIEHQAYVAEKHTVSNNFRGWRQYRDVFQVGA